MQTVLAVIDKIRKEIAVSPAKIVITDQRVKAIQANTFFMVHFKIKKFTSQRYGIPQNFRNE